MWIIFTSKRVVPTLQKTPCVLTKTNLLMLFRELFGQPYKAHKYTVRAKCKVS
jgi:hypothetical protein